MSGNVKKCQTCGQAENALVLGECDRCWNEKIGAAQDMTAVAEEYINAWVKGDE